jgi:putative transposase
MQPAEPHRKKVKHFDEPCHVHELTFSCYQRLPLLAEDRHKALLSQAVDAAMVGTRFHLVGFVYMPEHLHLIVFPLDECSKVSALLYAIKRPFSYRVKQDMVLRRDPRLAALQVIERPGKPVFRFWQEGPGYDRNLTRLDSVIQALEYAHANPVRRALCTCPAEWRWSSWHFYHAAGTIYAGLPMIHGLPPH